MKKIDILARVRNALRFLMLVFGILSSGGSGGILSLSSILIAIRGLYAALLINFNLDLLEEAFIKNVQNLSDLIELSERAKREGLLALENELHNVNDAFMKKDVLFAIDCVEPEIINDIMNAEFTAMEERHQNGRLILEKSGEYAPEWGLIGTLIGSVLMLSNLTDPTTIGASMSVAILTTFYGIVIADLVFIPIDGKLENKSIKKIFLKQIVIKRLIGIQSAQNPRNLKEKLSAFLSVKDIKKQTNSENAVDDFMEDSINEV